MWTPIISYVDLDDHLRKFCTSCELALLEAWQANEGLCRCLGDKTSHSMAYQRICYHRFSRIHSDERAAITRRNSIRGDRTIRIIFAKAYMEYYHKQVTAIVDWVSLIVSFIPTYDYSSRSILILS